MSQEYSRKHFDLAYTCSGKYFLSLGVSSFLKVQRVIDVDSDMVRASCCHGIIHAID